jgi:hypothetical protein
LTAGRPGVLHGNRTYLLQDENGQIIETHSISAGLDYPGVGPEHAWLKDSGRAEYVGVSDAEALQAFHDLCRLEGIIPALESSACPGPCDPAGADAGEGQILLVNLSGRGDKDMHTVADAIGHHLLIMGRIHALYSSVQAQGRKALIPFITAGDPERSGMDRSACCMRWLRMPAPTSSNSACLSLTRWPTDRPSSAPPSGRWRKASACARCSDLVRQLSRR